MLANIRSKFTPKVTRIIKFVLLLVLLALIGLAVYEARDQFGQLSSRIDSLEAKNREAENQQNEQASFVEEKIDYKEISKSLESVREEQPAEYYGPNDSPPPPKYETKRFYVYTLRITNGTSSAYSFSSGDIKGKTKEGTLIDAIYSDTIHDDDRKGKDTVSLAPKGTAQVVVYIPASEEIIELYFSPSTF